MNVVGLDLALTKTGLATSRGCHLVQPKTTGMDRLAYIRTAVADLIPFPPSETVVLIEGYSMGGQTGSAGVGQMLGEVGGIVRLYLWEHGIRYIDIPPSTLKKFATGKGNASKDLMVHTAAKLGCEAHDNNAVDAWWLRQMGLYWLSFPTAPDDPTGPDVPATKYRDEAVQAVTWPECTA